MSPPLSPVEGIKKASRLLRGTIKESLAEPVSGAMLEDDTHLIKFHGFYQQDDRDLRNERRQQRLEPAYQFMIRARIPGGLCTPAQWLAMDAIAHTYANHTLRLTTRQTFQFHGILKRDLKPAIAAINHALFDTLAACGDVNRNVMCTTLARPLAIRAEVEALAGELSERLLPKTGAYHEIWLDQEKIQGDEEEHEPLYGPTYLPRKFKIAVAVPPDNDVDIFSQDLGFIAILEHERIIGFNVTVGGGLGMSHGEYATFPRVAEVLGYCTPSQVVKVAEAVLIAQRDFGDRTNRKHARLKYTIETLGLERFREEVATRAGFALASPRPFQFTHTGDRNGWQDDGNGLAHYTVFVTSGRIDDQPERRAMTALREIAKRELAQFRLTANQNVVLAKVSLANRAQIMEILTVHGLGHDTLTPLRQLALACVGFPTCGLAMAESERYLDDFVGKIESLMSAHGLRDAPLVVRITGCPNGCARPYLAEIALVGKAPGRYNLYLGAAYNGTRLNSPYRESLNEAEILALLEPLFSRYARERIADEHFGNFLVRVGIVAAIETGPAFAAAAQALGTVRQTNS
jgi:sulfite reductase (NADPH) hemoprotein beta-component